MDLPLAARRARRAWLAEVKLPSEGGDVAVESSGFREVAPEMAFAKGGRPFPRNEVSLDVALTGLGPGAINGTLELGAGYFRRWPSVTIGPHLSFGEHDGHDFRRRGNKRWTARPLPRLAAAVDQGSARWRWGWPADCRRSQERIDVDETFLGWTPSASALLALDLPSPARSLCVCCGASGVSCCAVDDQLKAHAGDGTSLGLVTANDAGHSGSQELQVERDMRMTATDDQQRT